MKRESQKRLSERKLKDKSALKVVAASGKKENETCEQSCADSLRKEQQATATTADSDDRDNNIFDSGAAYETLLRAHKEFYSGSDNIGVAPCFSLHSRNGSASPRKIADAYAFLVEYGFVCIASGEEEFFAQQCKNLKTLTLSERPAAHEAYAFLHQTVPSSGNDLLLADSVRLNSATQRQARQVLDEEIHDYYTDSVCHSQAAWDLRCNAVLRQFFSSVYSRDLEASAPCTTRQQQHRQQQVLADDLLPSIESVQCVGDRPPILEQKQAIGKQATPCSLLEPTFHTNPTWTRAPHVIGAYHLDAYSAILQKHWSEYIKDVNSGLLNDDRTQQRWLLRLRKEIVATARKIVLGKRATNKMVHDAAFHSKKGFNTTLAAMATGEERKDEREKEQKEEREKEQKEERRDENLQQQTDVEAMRPLVGGYEAMICVGSAALQTKSSNDERDKQMDGEPPIGYICVVPKFHQYYPHYLAHKRAKWAHVSGDCLQSPLEDDPYSAALFASTAIRVPMRTGHTLILDRRVPRWLHRSGESASQAMLILPVSYRWQQHNVCSEQRLSSLPNYAIQAALLAQACPMELALRSTYLNSLANGIVFTSLPHLTGAVHFARSTKKTALDLKHKRLNVYNGWLRTLSSAEEKDKVEHHYVPPTLPPFMRTLLTRESDLICDLDAENERLLCALKTAESRRKVGAQTSRSAAAAAAGSKRKRLPKAKRQSKAKTKRRRLGNDDNNRHVKRQCHSVAGPENLAFQNLEDVGMTQIKCGDTSHRNQLRQFLMQSAPASFSNYDCNSDNSFFPPEEAALPPPLFGNELDETELVCNSSSSFAW